MGSAESEEYDQILDSVLVGPVPAGRHMFVFEVSSNFFMWKKKAGTQHEWRKKSNHLQCFLKVGLKYSTNT